MRYFLQTSWQSIANKQWVHKISCTSTTKQEASKNKEPSHNSFWIGFTWWSDFTHGQSYMAPCLRKKWATWTFRRTNKWACIGSKYTCTGKQTSYHLIQWQLENRSWISIFSGQFSKNANTSGIVLLKSWYFGQDVTRKSTKIMV